MENSNLSTTEQRGWFGRHRWVPFVLPLLVYVASGQFDSQLSNSAAQPAAESVDTSIDRAAGVDSGQATQQTANWYPLIYTGRVLLTLAVMALALPTYRLFEFRVSLLAIACGVVGVLLWVGICALDLEQRYILPAMSALFGNGGRAAYNPLEQLAGQPFALAGFLAVRFLGLALIVPIVEEFFLRGFLQRFVMEPDWWTLPIGATNAMAWTAVIAYAVLTHPGEMIAAAIWFSLITWLVARTHNIWDAVAAHAVTNLLLGVYVLISGEWRLW